MITYDELPYGGRPVPHSHPDVLALHARMRGADPVPSTAARILELGCAEGANLLPMAFHLRDSELVGVDAAATHIARAQAQRERLGLTNVRFLHADIAELGDDLGTFDYVIGHGVLSWVGDRVRDRIWALLRDHLTPRGVAYLSYNTGPGWALRGALRNALAQRAASSEDLAAKVGRMRQLLGLLATSPVRETTYGAYLAEEAQLLSAQRDEYLVHEHLATEHRVFSYREICAKAADHGLAVVGELSRAWLHREVEEGVRAALAELTDDPIESEELADLVLGRTFRMSVFARLAPEASPPGDAIIDECELAAPIRARETRISLDEGTNEVFLTPDGAQIAARSAVLKGALWEIARAWPNALAFDTLCTSVERLLRARRVLGATEALDTETRDALRADVLRLAKLGHVELRLRSLCMASEVGPSPRVSSLTRAEAERSAAVTNPFHRVVELDEVGRELVGLLDGLHGRGELPGELAARLDARGVELRDATGAALVGEALDATLRELVESRLLALAVNGLLALP